MTINKAYLGTLRATVTLTYIPVLTPGLYDTFPVSPETFPGHIGSFPGRFWMEILIFYLHTIEPIYGNINICIKRSPGNEPLYRGDVSAREHVPRHK